MTDVQLEKVRLICITLLREHLDMKRFMGGIGTAEQCQCPVCKAATELMEEIKCE